MQLHLNSFGAYLHVKDAMFDVRKKQADGSVESRSVAASKVKSIWLGRGTMLSTEAVRLALTNNIDVVFLENDGRPLGRVWHSKLGSTVKIRRAQLAAADDGRAVVFVKKWLSKKLENQADFLRDLKKHRPQRVDFLNEKISKIDGLKSSIEGAKAARVDAVAESLRGWEGTAGRFYFETLSDVLPPNWKFEGRSSRPARDAFNAFLNYGYGVLYARVEKALMLAGLDPFVGFLHRDDYNHRSLVFDFIEPYRGWVEGVVFRLFSGKKVNQECFDENASNGVHLNPEGKKRLMEPLNDFWEGDIIRYRGRNRSRASILLLDAHQLAQELLHGSAAAGEEVEIDVLEV